MRRTRTLGLCLLAALALAIVPAGSASASGPEPPGKEIIEINCGGTPVTVAPPASGHAQGTAQIVGAKGHGTPVTVVVNITDLNTGEVVVSETHTKGNGHAHPNQATTRCSLPVFEGEASEVFGTELPEGVAGTDIVRVALEVDFVTKP